MWPFPLLTEVPGGVGSGGPPVDGDLSREGNGSLR